MSQSNTPPLLTDVDLEDAVIADAKAFMERHDAAFKELAGIPEDSRKGRIMSSTLACVTKYDAALRRLANR